jgi:WD40 repeat protein
LPLQGVHKSEVTSLHLVKRGEPNDISKWRAVSTSTDGFINMVDIDSGATQKTFFVNQTGIIDATPLAQEDSFALALQNNCVSLFSFKTGTTIQTFNAHDDAITKILFRQRFLVTCSSD